MTLAWAEAVGTAGNVIVAAWPGFTLATSTSEKPAVTTIWSAVATEAKAVLPPPGSPTTPLTAVIVPAIGEVRSS